METKREEISWVIGGPQGSGVDSASHIFIKSIAMSGLNIFGKREYYSNIKGEHSYFTVRVSNKKVRSHVDEIDILVTFDAETVLRHSPYIINNGILIFDPEIRKKKFDDLHFLDYSSLHRIKAILDNNNLNLDFSGILDYLKQKRVLLIEIPYFDLIRDFSEKINAHELSKLARITNVMSLASSLALLNLDHKIMEKGIKSIFTNKPKIAEINVNAANYVYNYVKVKYENDIKEFAKKLNFDITTDNQIIAQGNQSSPLGKIVAGCRFQTYYPITPASDDSEYLEQNQIFKQVDKKNGSVVVVQTEDEIAAITMAIGASLTGTRSCTSTSGPGFSLMAEALGWAGMNEVPLVVSLYQRAGPSTGLPTRHEQSDLLFAINAGHGEFPKIVYSSGDIEESFYDTIKVFNYAEKFQMPVIHILDKYIANSTITSKLFNYKKMEIERGRFYESVPKQPDDSHFKRFDFHDGPISDRVPLGTENGIFWNTGDEHDERGHITEDPYIRKKMMEKRMSKLEIIIDQIPQNDQVRIEFDDTNKVATNSTFIILSWGSTKGAILDTLEELSPKFPHIKFIYIQIKLLNPFPSKLLEEILSKKMSLSNKSKTNSIKTDSNTTNAIINIEMNYSSQLNHLLNQYTSINVDYNIVKYNGRPISHSELYETLSNIIDKKTEKKVILENGV